MKARFLRAGLCVLPMLLSVNAEPVDDSSPAHTAIERALAEEQLAGAVWSTVMPDGTIVTDAAGLKNASTGERLSVEARVHIGSVTKPLLALGVLRLITQGRFTLDTPVSKLLPHVAIDNPWAQTDPVTVRNLLDHTAGLDDSRLWQVFSLKPTPDTPLAAAFKTDRTLLRARSRPGARFSYSNMGYTLLGMVIEAATGERYERYLDRHLLQPLDMRDSTFSFVSQVGRDADARLAMGHFENGVTQHTVPIYLRPAVQFTTTARDMGKLARFLLSDGRIDGQRFIDATLLRQMGEPVGTEAARAGLRAGYGLGLAQRDRHGVIGRCHGGNTVGYRAMLCVFPQQRAAFFIAFNADNEAADYGRFDKLLVESLNVAESAPVTRGVPATDLSAWNGVYVPAPNRFATFAWVDTIFGFVRVRWDGRQLQLRTLESAPIWLTPAGGYLFRAPGRLTVSHVVLSSAQGGRLMSTGLQTFERRTWTYLILLWGSVTAGVLGMVLILALGLWRLCKRSLRLADPLCPPFVSAIAVFVSVAMFLPYSFLQLGDVTAASMGLAVTTAALPLALLTGIALRVRQGFVGRTAIVEAVAILAVLQWMLVLAAWNLIPLRLWA